MPDKTSQHVATSILSPLPVNRKKTDNMMAFNFKLNYKFSFYFYNFSFL